LKSEGPIRDLARGPSNCPSRTGVQLKP